MLNSSKASTRDAVGNIFLFASALVSIVLHQPAAAEESSFYKELNLIGGYSELDGWVWEKGRIVKNSIGCEYFRKFVGEYGDFLTCDIQARMSYDSSADADDAWGFEVHNAWLEYKLALGKNVRFGHFAPAFGLEPQVDTHGTLFQTLAPLDLGFKKDWGIGYRGMLGRFDCEAAAQIGSGMGIEHKDGSFLASTRIGTPQGQDFQYGCSVLYGEVLFAEMTRTIPYPNYADDATLKKRIGADAQYFIGSYLFRGEATFGRNESNDVFGALLQMDYTVQSLQNMVIRTQGRYWSDDPGESERTLATLGLVVSYNILPPLTARLGVFYDFEKPDEKDDTSIFLQLYYYSL